MSTNINDELKSSTELKKLLKARSDRQKIMINNVSGPSFNVSQTSLRSIVANSQPVVIYPGYQTSVANRVVMREIRTADHGTATI